MPGPGAGQVGEAAEVAALPGEHLHPAGLHLHLLVLGQVEHLVSDPARDDDR